MELLPAYASTLTWTELSSAEVSNSASSSLARRSCCNSLTAACKENTTDSVVKTCYEQVIAYAGHMRAKYSVFVRWSPDIILQHITCCMTEHPVVTQAALLLCGHTKHPLRSELVWEVEVGIEPEGTHVEYISNFSKRAAAGPHRWLTLRGVFCQSPDGIVVVGIG